MAEKDIETKNLESYPDVFADIFNVLLFKENRIQPAQLEDGPTETIYKDAKRKNRQQSRDEMKRYLGENRLLISMLGMENQTSVERFMPVRAFSYDAGAYKSQANEVSRKDKKTILYPVISIVLNFSNERWYQPKNLKGLMEIPEWMN